MKILYLAKHGSGGNDDEGAIAYALRKLGCDVVELHEREVHRCGEYCGQGVDFLLCHHLNNVQALTRLKFFKVCWCFDLIDWPVPVERHCQRRAWASVMAGACDLVFHTDGDWVKSQAQFENLVWLTQGADERDVPHIMRSTNDWDVLFVGGGKEYGRAEFVAEMERTYGRKFKHIDRGWYGSTLQEAIMCARVVVCPPSPVTDLYWSNRIYNMCRLGAFVMHPKCGGLEQQYGNLVEYYDGMAQLHRLIKWAVNLSPEARFNGTRALLDHTLRYHTYRHRCAELLGHVCRRLSK